MKSIPVSFVAAVMAVAIEHSQGQSFDWCWTLLFVSVLVSIALEAGFAGVVFYLLDDLPLIGGILCFGFALPILASWASPLVALFN